MLTITPSAAARIEILLKEELPNSFLRLSIMGGGCSGFQYNFTFDDTITTDDTVFEEANVRVVVDETSLALLDGSILDFVEDMSASRFTVTNPNAASGCGCGNSFTI
jgi:iron-sulfur cluster insertion protein